VAWQLCAAPAACADGIGPWPIWAQEWNDDANDNRLDDHLEGFGAPGETVLVDLFITFGRSDWDERKAELLSDVQAVLDMHSGTVADDYEVMPTLLVQDAELLYPLWMEGEGYFDPLLYDLFETFELPIVMCQSLHRFAPALTDYLLADRIAPDLWVPAAFPNIPGPGAGIASLVAIVDTGAEELGIDHYLYAGGYDAFNQVEEDPHDLSANSGLYHGTRVGYAATGWDFAPIDLYGAAPLSAFIDIRVAEEDTAYGAHSGTIMNAINWLWAKRADTFTANYGAQFDGIDVASISYADMGPVAHRFVPGSGDCATIAPSDGNDPISLAADTLSELGGVSVVAAAGNCGTYPTTGFGQLAAADEVITVGAYDMADPATRADDLIFDWTSHGPGPQSTPKPDLVAPGAVLFDQGTSFAAPQVAGAVALLREIDPLATPAEIKQALIESAVKAPGYFQHDDHWGHGLLDAAAARDSLD